MKKTIYLTSIIFTCIVTQIQAQFTISGEIRPRTEFRNGFKKLTTEGTDAAFFTEQRSRLYFDYTADKYKIKIALQDVRIWGENGQIHKTDNGMSTISEAWGQVFVSDKSSLKFGRQIISYDNQRFLGGLEWALQGRRHDALLYIYNNSEAKSQLHVGVALNQNVNEPVALTGTTYPLQNSGKDVYHATNNYKTMQYAWYHKDFEGGKYSLLAFNEGRQNEAEEIAFRQTFGFNGEKKFGSVALGAELFYQTGKVAPGAGVKKDVSAYLMALNATFKTSVTPVTIGVDYLSGNDMGNTNKQNGFAPAFGTNHAFYGFMDYFYVGNGFGNVGLTDVYVKTKFKTGEKSNLMVHFHDFMSSGKILEGDGTTEASSQLGTEIDLVYTKVISPEVTFNLGYSQLFASSSMELLKGGDKGHLQNWAFAMIAVKPTFFSTK